MTVLASHVGRRLAAAVLVLAAASALETSPVPLAAAGGQEIRPVPGQTRPQSPSGGKVEVAFQPGKGLSIRGAGGVDLQPWRPHQFRVKEFPDVVVSFTVEGGKVLAMRQRDPSGEFVFPRLQ